MMDRLMETFEKDRQVKGTGLFMKAVRLRTEYLKNPIGIDIVRPRLSWNCQDGERQSAWQVTASDDGGKLLWDSGRVPGSRMVHIPWGGEDVAGRTKVIWRVKLWDENGMPGEFSEPAFFETGLLKGSDWKAKWITGNYHAGRKERYPADCFRRCLTVKGKVAKARLYITACGIYEARINGRKAGDYVLAPGITDYRRRIQYQTYDVTELLTEGANEWTLELADGWYRGSVGAWGLTCWYGTETKLLAQLEIYYEDGRKERVATDGRWDWSNDGPVRFADNKDGERVDARKKPSYHGKAKVTDCKVIPSASNNVEIREKERLRGTASGAADGSNTVLLLDFGQNFAGYVELRVKAGEGQKLSMRFGELLDGNGRLTLKNIQCVSKKKTSPLQQVDYICHEGENHYKTKFAIFGFRYVEVSADMEVRPDDFTGIAVYSDMEQTAWFDSSNPLLDQLVRSTLWSARSNSADLPTDCPTRERHGWTGDAQIFFETAGYLMDYGPFARKYLKDLRDSQKKDGRFLQIVPEGGTDFYMAPMNGSPGWSDAGIIMPYRFWKLFGDMQIILENYDAMASYAGFLMKRCGKRGPFSQNLGLKGEAAGYAVNKGQAYGEWAEPADVHVNKWTDMAAPHPEVATAYTSYCMSLMEEMARTLGREEDARIYGEYAQKTREAYQELSRTERFSLDTDRQARLVRPLYFGLLDQGQAEFAGRRLIEALEHYGWRLGTGFLSTPLILYVLSELDIEYAYRLLENEEMPGWLFLPKNGATTIWESWEGTMAQGGIASLNHYSKGAVCEWVFKVMCGAQVKGENHFLLSPRPGGHFTRAGLAWQSIYGKVESGWEKKGSGVEFSFTIPANCTADIVLPGGRKEQAGPGKHVFWEALREVGH